MNPRILILLTLISVSPGAFAEVDTEQYQDVTQADLVADRETYQEEKVKIEGSFLFTGSDFCYQIRKTKINTRDYLCFALGTPSVVRLYLKKDHPQADRLMHLKRGEKVTAYGTFDYVGSNYNFMIVDRIAVENAG